MRTDRFVNLAATALGEAHGRLRHLGFRAPELILRISARDLTRLQHDPDARGLLEVDADSKGRYHRLAGHLVLVFGEPIDAAQALEDENARLRARIENLEAAIANNAPLHIVSLPPLAAPEVFCRKCRSYSSGCSMYGCPIDGA